MIPAAVQDAVDRAGRRPGQPAVTGTRAGGLALEGRPMVNFACNDYLGLAHDRRVLAAAHAALDRFGTGTAAGRVLSGTTVVHLELEARLADWVGCEAAVLHPSCWTANAAVIAVLGTLVRDAGSALAVFSDRLNHASIIDAIRAQRALIGHTELYDHNNLDGLRRALADAPAHLQPVVVTDGVFSMEGDLAPLGDLVQMCGAHDALLVVDDSHGTGVVGATGRGTAQATGTLGRIDVVTGTIGKALGGAIGGFVAGPADLMDALRTRSRPYVFSNNPPTSVAAAALAGLDVLAEDDTALQTLRARVSQLRDGIAEIGLPTYPGDHPIVPVVLGTDEAAAAASRDLSRAGMYATALTFPIVPHGTARLRLQVSAGHDVADIDRLLAVLADTPGAGT